MNKASEERRALTEDETKQITAFTKYDERKCSKSIKRK